MHLERFHRAPPTATISARSITFVRELGEMSCLKLSAPLLALPRASPFAATNLKNDSLAAHVDKETVFKFPGVTPLSCALDAPIVQCRGVSFSFPPSSLKGKQSQSQPLLEGVTLDLTRRSRVVLVGRNGSGKSTLLKLIAAATEAGGGAGVAAGGEGLSPTEGTIVRNHNARVGLFTQVCWRCWWWWR